MLAASLSAEHSAALKIVVHGVVAGVTWAATQAAIGTRQQRRAVLVLCALQVGYALVFDRSANDGTQIVRDQLNAPVAQAERIVVRSQRPLSINCGCILYSDLSRHRRSIHVFKRDTLLREIVSHEWVEQEVLLPLLLEQLLFYATVVVYDKVHVVRA